MICRSCHRQITTLIVLNPENADVGLVHWIEPCRVYSGWYSGPVGWLACSDCGERYDEFVRERHHDFRPTDTVIMEGML